MTTTPPDSRSARPADDVTSAVDALGAGQVVALPTETVYGLAVRADAPEALSRLVELECGPDEPGSEAAGWNAPTLHTVFQAAPQAESEAGYARMILDEARLPAVARRLAERYWPGPLTLVLQSRGDDGSFAGLGPLAASGWTGVRVPSHETTQAILQAAPFPVAVLRAQRRGREAALSASEVREQFTEAQVPLIIDGGGATLLGSPSTALAIGSGRFEVLRGGIVTESDLRRAAGLSLLFVCTGNTCRSPMAEALARTALRRSLGAPLEGGGSGLDETAFGFTVASAGVYAGVGSPPSEHAVTALSDRGIDLSGHGSRPAIDREVAEADRVYCLTQSHRAALLSMLPPSASDSVELLDPAGRDVPDPFGGPLEVYRETADVLESFIEARLPSWV